MRRLLAAFSAAAFLSTAALAGGDAQPPSTADIVAGVESAYRDVHSLRADFVQVTRSPSLGTEEKQKGKLHLKRPRMMRMEFTGPDARLVVTDGEKIWIYSPADKQAFLYQDLGTGGGMGVLLDDLDKLDEHFDVRRVEDDRRSYVLELTPKTEAPFKSLRVEVSRGQYTLKRIVIVDQMGNETELAFSQVKTNVDLPDSEFQFQVPKGAKVIEGM